MNIEQYRDYCMAKTGVTEEFPFDNETLVFKVGGKMFALTGIEHFTSINLKCDPERAVELRDQHPSIKPGWHMNKTHWNTILLDGSLADKFIYELIDHSYRLVFDSLPKRIRKNI